MGAPRSRSWRGFSRRISGSRRSSSSSLRCRLLYTRKLPRLSPATSVAEALFDSLYTEAVIDEPVFHAWVEDQSDSRRGKIDVVFATSPWFDWLRAAKVEGESSSSEDSASESEESEQE